MLTRWNPNRDLLSFPDEVSQLFDSFLVGAGPRAAAAGGPWLPAVDVHENDDAYTLQFDLPGVNPKDVKVQVIGDTLSIRGERHAERDEKTKTTHRVERVSGTFERAFRLGTALDAAQVKATYRDGVLEVTAPKLEHAKTREIAIEVQK
jgi:HSP20 family protein